MFDFPSSPTVGQKYPVSPAVGQVQYTWDGEKWTTAGAQITNAGPATVAPLMDSTAAVGVAAKYAREDHVHPKIYAAPFDAMAFNGMQINGNFDVSQELGNGFCVFSGAMAKFTVDCWQMQNNGAQGGNAYRFADPFAGYAASLNTYATVANAAPAASNYTILVQRLEGSRIVRLKWGTANAQPITIAFWVTSTRTGMFSGSIRQFDSANSYVFTYTVNVANTPEFKVITIPGPTIGTWQSGANIGFQIAFALLCGTQYATTPGGWVGGNWLGATGTTNLFADLTGGITITGVMILPGLDAPSAAQASLVSRPYEAEMEACLRQFQGPSSGGSMGYNGFTVAPTMVRVGIPFHSIMRVTPTLLSVSPGAISVNTLAQNTVASIISLQGAGLNAAAVDLTCPSGTFTQGQGCTAGIQRGAMWFDARL
jgi:hypothetical protein